MSRLLIPTALLTLVYALVLASFDPWDLALGAVVSLAILLFLRRSSVDEDEPAESAPRRRLVAFAPFAGALLWEILVGSWQVAVFVLDARSPARPGVVSVTASPPRCRTPGAPGTPEPRTGPAGSRVARSPRRRRGAP